MKLSEKEKEAHKQAFRKMNFQDKMIYIFSYYKSYILIPLLVLLLAGHFIVNRINRKEDVLYLAMANVAAGEDLISKLDQGFITQRFENNARKRVLIYKDLYLSDDASDDNNRYAYASKIKLLGSIETEKLDLVITNAKGYELLSQSGYLYNLDDLLPADMKESLSSYLTINEILLNDNRIDHLLGEEDLDLSSKKELNGINISSFPLIEKAGFPETLYLCVIANSNRTDLILSYIRYLHHSLSD